MRTRTIRDVAIGSAAVLCLTSAPVLLGSVAAQAAPPSTTPSATALTAAQATAVYQRLTDKLATTSVIHGLRLRVRETHVSYSGGPAEVSWTSTVVVDPKRRIVRETGDLASHTYGLFDAAYEVPCGRETVGQGGHGTTETTITKAGTAEWQKVRKGRYTYPHVQKLKILGSHAKWERLSRKVSLRTAVRSTSTFEDLHRSGPQLREFTGGSSKAAGAGRSYTLSYTSPGIWETAGRIEATVDAAGIVTALRRLVVDDRVAGAKPTATTAYAIAYGAQRLQVPKKSTVVTHARMVSACHALRTKETVRRLAESVRVEVNGQGRRTPSRIRSTAERFAPPKSSKLRVSTSPIRSGVMIVGRHKLLEHPVVWTVFIRDGKAVTHQVT